jgi:hypothetical protein
MAPQRRTLTDARRQLLQAQTRLREIELQEKNGELVCRDVVEREWFKIERQVRDVLLNIPTRLSGILAAERSQDRCFSILERELLQALESLTNGRPNGHTDAMRPVPPPRKKDPQPKR